MYSIEDNLQKLLEEYNPKSYVSAIKRRAKMLAFVEEKQIELGTSTIIETLYCWHNSVQPTKCPCGNNAIFNTFVKGYRKFCSHKCPEKGNKHSAFVKEMWTDEEKLERMKANLESTMIERYGTTNAMAVPEFKKKVIDTNMTRYGAATPFESPEIRKKASKICFEKYGVNHPLQSAEIHAKTLDTSLKKYGGFMTQARKAAYEKYGGVNPFSVPSVQEKSKKTRLERYGTEYHSQSEDWRNKVATTCLEKYGRTAWNQKDSYSDELYTLLTERPEEFKASIKGKNTREIMEHYSFRSTDAVLAWVRKLDAFDVIDFNPLSAMEDEVVKWLDEWGVNYKRNDRTVIKPLELDFILPDHQIAIELHGLYFHCELSAGKGRDYHYGKFISARDSGYDLIQINQDDFWERKSAIYSKLRRIVCSEVGELNLFLDIDVSEDEVIDFVSKHATTVWNYGNVVGIRNDNELVGVVGLEFNNESIVVVDIASIIPEDACAAAVKERIDAEVNIVWNNNWPVDFGDAGFGVVNEKPPTWNYVAYYDKCLFEVTNVDTEWKVDSEFGLDRIWNSGKTVWSSNVLN